MGEAIGQIMGNAVGVAISPVPIIAVILMLFSRSAARNSLAFMFGWLLGLIVAATIILAIGLDSSDTPSDAIGWLKIAIGAVFLFLGVKQWKGRPREGVEPEMPAWMASIDDMAAGKAFGLGALLSGVNPKNLGLTIAAAASISSAGLSGGDQAITVGVFVLIASITIIVPVVGYLIAGERVAPLLESMKGWLTQNNATVMTVLFVVLGAKVLGDGISVVA
ncbi:GAP family protein [Ilumatobacter nonamiensis]|uniref:GAP family protein n=1 Tax=Ilumatobacter nonamiensis TaxID=467093 RepID=UPI00034A9768|nr:GAP family protein [Ilumatobacter nonamiensis]